MMHFGIAEDFQVSTMGGLSILLLGLSLALPGAARGVSTGPAHRCDAGAGPYAISEVAGKADPVTRYVFGEPGEIGKFPVQVGCGSAPSGPSGAAAEPGVPEACTPCSLVLAELPAEDRTLALVRRIRDAWRGYGRSFHANETVSYDELAPWLSGRPPRSGPGDPTAYDLVQDSSIRNAIADAVNRLVDHRPHLQTVRSRLREVVATGQPGAGLRMAPDSGASVRIRVVFSDGSLATVRIAPANPDRAEYVLGTAVDAKGASIPDPSYDPETGISPGGAYLPGSHRPQDRHRWCELATTMAGIHCSIGTGAGGTGGIDCWRVNGGPLQCSGS